MTVPLQVIYEEGGIYLDLDIVALKPFTELIGEGKYEAVFGRQVDGLPSFALLLHGLKFHTESINDAVFMAKKGSPIIAFEPK